MAGAETHERPSFFPGGGGGGIGCDLESHQILQKTPVELRSGPFFGTPRGEGRESREVQQGGERKSPVRAKMQQPPFFWAAAGGTCRNLDGHHFLPQAAVEPPFGTTRRGESG